MAKTMKKDDVIFPDRTKTSGMPPKQFGALLATVKGECETKIGSVPPDGQFAKARALLQPFIAKPKDYAEVYWKVGFIGNDLYFRVKSKKKGIRGATGYTHEDVLLKKGAKAEFKKIVAGGGGDTTPKPKKGQPTVVKLPTYVMWDKTRASTLLKEQEFVSKLDNGRASCQLTLTIPGAVTGRPLDECKRIAQGVLEDVSSEVESAIDALERSMIASKGDPAKLKLAAATTAKKVKELTDAKRVEKIVEEKCNKFLKDDKQLKKLNTEFKVKAAFTVVGKTLSGVLATTRLVFSGGTEASAYLSLASAAYGMYKVVDDILKKEPALREDLVKKIKDYEEKSDLSLDKVKGMYQEEVQDKAGTVFGKAKARLAQAQRGAEMTAQVLNDKAKEFVGKYVSEKLASLIPSLDLPEASRKRYAVDVGGFIKKLDAEYKKVEKTAKKLQGSKIGDAVTLWQKFQLLKKSYETLRAELMKRLAFLTECKAKIQALGIETSDATGLDKIKQIKKAFQQRKIGDAVDGLKEIASDVNTVRGILSTIVDLGKEIAANV